MNGVLKTLYFLGVLAETAIRLPHERRRRQTRIAVDHMDVSERRLAFLMFVGMFFIPAVYALTPWLDRTDYRLPEETKGRVGGVGTITMAAAVWLFWRPHVGLGRNWSPSLQLREEHTLVTKGVYHWIRYPMYAFIYVALGHNASFVASELDIRLNQPDAVSTLIPVAGAARGADDVGAFRGDLSCVYGSNRTHHSLDARATISPVRFSGNSR